MGSTGISGDMSAQHKAEKAARLAAYAARLADWKALDVRTELGVEMLRAKRVLT